jgi:twitching motility protein PilT
VDLGTLLHHLVEVGGTDLVVKAGSSPHVRVDGHLVRTPFDAPDPASIPRLLDGVVPRLRAEELESTGETEFAYGVSGVGRFRISAYRQRGSLALTCRHVAPGLPPAQALGLPPVLDKLCGEGRGFVLVTGPAGAGTTTTLSALIDYVNTNRACHIVTVEQPIEHLHPDKQAIVSQREVGTDTSSVAAAIRRAARQGADVLAVGVVPDHDAVRALLDAAEGGALVFAVVSSLSAPEALVRFIESFPEAERRRVRATLAPVLRGVLGQRLLERADGKGRIGAFEVLLGTSKVADCVAEDRLDDLPRLVADGEYNGMQTLDEPHGAGDWRSGSTTAIGSLPRDPRPRPTDRRGVPAPGRALRRCRAPAVPGRRDRSRRPARP